MTDFDHILNWRLQRGSHEFPGPDGGTCINEAAIVAAGFEYKRVESAYECPPCFSRVLATYALNLNDRMPDDERQRLLMPFVTRLAGTADTPEIERQRAKYMAIETVRRIIGPLMRARGKVGEAEACERAQTLVEARAAANAADADAAANAAAYAAYAANAADAAANAADAAADAAATPYWQAAASILDGAMQIGNRAEPLDLALVVERMEAVKVLVNND